MLSPTLQALVGDVQDQLALPGLIEEQRQRLIELEKTIPLDSDQRTNYNNLIAEFGTFEQYIRTILSPVANTTVSPTFY